MPLVSERDKQTDLESVITSAAENHETGITTNTHQRLAGIKFVTPRKRDETFGNPHYYAEIIPVGAPPGDSTAGGQAQSVDHTFEVWLIYEYEEWDSYSGSTQETFDKITEGLNPQGVLPTLRDASVRTIGGNPVTYFDPIDRNKTLVSVGERGGSVDYVHQLTFQIVLTEPS